MTMHEHLRRLVEAREVDSIRDRKHEFSVLAGIRPNLPSLEEAAGDLDEAAGEYTIPKDVLSKIGGWTFEMPVERLFAKARKGPLSKAEVQKIVKSLKFEIQDMQRGGERDGVKKFTWLLNTMRTLKPLKEDLDDLDEGEQPYTRNAKAMAKELDGVLSGEHNVMKLAKKINSLKSFHRMVGMSQDMVKDALMALEDQKAIPQLSDDKFSTLRFKLIKLIRQKAKAYQKKVESADDLDEALGVPALNKWKMHQKGGTTAYAITLHGKKVIVGETPSPKGSGLYRYSLYIDGAKYGKQDFTSTRDLFQTIQKAVVEGDDHPFDEAYGDIAMVGSFKNKAGDKAAIYKGPDGYFIQGKTGAGKMIMASGFKSEKDATKWLIKKRIKTEGHDEADDIEEAARPTFKKAREALLKYLDKEGWDVKTWGPGGALKIPHATHPHQNLKLWFKGQAVYQSGAKGNIKQARSTWVDIRDMSPEEFVQEVEK